MKGSNIRKYKLIIKNMDTLISIFNCSEDQARAVLLKHHNNLELAIEDLLNNASSSSSSSSISSIPLPPSSSSLPIPPITIPIPITTGSSSSSSSSSSNKKITVLEISQYSFDIGTSSCTSICMNIITKLLNQLRLNQDIHSISTLSDAMIEGISIHNSIQNMNSSSHLSVDEVFFVSENFQEQLIYCISEPYQGLLNNHNTFQVLFDKILKDIREKYSSSSLPIAICITKPPETICIIISNDINKPIHLYDSHSRPSIGLNGAYLISSNINDIIDHINKIWPAFNDDGDGGYMMEMYNMYEMHPFILRDIKDDDNNNNDWVYVKDEDMI